MKGAVKEINHHSDFPVRLKYETSRHACSATPKWTIWQNIFLIKDRSRGLLERQFMNKKKIPK